MEVGHSGTQGNKSKQEEKGRKGECHVIKITKKMRKRPRDTAGNLRKKKKSENELGQEGG